MAVLLRAMRKPINIETFTGNSKPKVKIKPVKSGKRKTKNKSVKTVKTVKPSKPQKTSKSEKTIKTGNASEPVITSKAPEASGSKRSTNLNQAESSKNGITQQLSVGWKRIKGLTKRGTSNSKD